MPKLPGPLRLRSEASLFDSFDNLDQIQIEDVAKWLKPQPSLAQLENYLAQKILYPQTVPITANDMKIDLAILREALNLSVMLGHVPSGTWLGDNPFLNITLRKILIPKRFLIFVPNLPTLTWIFVDGLLHERKRGDFFEDLWTVEVRGETDEVIGSVLLPRFKNESGILYLTVRGKKYQIRAGTLTNIPCPNKRCEVSFKLKGGEILGKDDLQVEVYGGELGLMVDGRRV